jgi:hypothetical protein
MYSSFKAPKLLYHFFNNRVAKEFINKSIINSQSNGPGFRLQASCFRDGLILHACEREGLNHWQYHKVVAKLYFMARSGSRSVHLAVDTERSFQTVELQQTHLDIPRTMQYRIAAL